MNKKVFFILVFFLTFFINSNILFGADVEITSNIYTNKTIFTYLIEFDENEDYNSFSLEKPKDSTIISISDLTNSSIKYTLAGDYFIFEPKKTANNSIEIKFETQFLSSQIKEKDIFNVYFNFNFPVNNLKYRVVFEDLSKSVSNLLPRNYNVFRENEYVWELTDIKKDTFFSISFNSEKDKSTLSRNFYEEYMFIIYLISFILIIIIIFLILKIINKIPTFSSINKKEKEANKNKTEIILTQENKKKIESTIFDNGEKEEKNNSNENLLKPKTKTIVPEIIIDKKQKYADFIEKYLTENERSVVNIVSSNKGITQNEILNFIPFMKKSNLSKIITKLHSRKILNKVRVGKITKIYFGEKLEEFEKD